MDSSLPFFAALLASVLHVIAGPDHLAAVMAFAVESKRKAWKIGLLWGLGHLLGMLLIGLVYLAFKQFVPLEGISHYSEKLVGLVLIGIGVWALIRIYRKPKHHSHLHLHNGDNPVIHKHPHDHSQVASHGHSHSPALRQSKTAAFGVGMLHGFAGIAHFLLFLPVLSYDSTADSLGYIAGFALGTVFAMTAFAFVIGELTAISKDRHSDAFFKGLYLAAGLFALITGFYWLIAA